MPVNRAAFAANRRLAKFLPRFIRIDNILALSTPGGPASKAPGPRGSTGWFHISPHEVNGYAAGSIKSDFSHCIGDHQADCAIAIGGDRADLSDLVVARNFLRLGLEVSDN
jgi:hypothetical protein